LYQEVRILRFQTAVYITWFLIMHIAGDDLQSEVLPLNPLKETLAECSARADLQSVCRASERERVNLCTMRMRAAMYG